MPQECNPNLIICVNEEKAYRITSLLLSTFKIECNNACFKNSNKLIKEKKRMFRLL